LSFARAVRPDWLTRELFPFESRFATILPRAKTIVLSGAGHYVQEESPAEIAAAIRAWWSTDVQAET